MDVEIRMIGQSSNRLDRLEGRCSIRMKPREKDGFMHPWAAVQLILIGDLEVVEITSGCQRCLKSLSQAERREEEQKIIFQPNIVSTNLWPESIIVTAFQLNAFIKTGLSVNSVYFKWYYQVGVSLGINQLTTYLPAWFKEYFIFTEAPRWITTASSSGSTSSEEELVFLLIGQLTPAMKKFNQDTIHVLELVKPACKAPPPPVQESPSKRSSLTLVSPDMPSPVRTPIITCPNL